MKKRSQQESRQKPLEFPEKRTKKTRLPNRRRYTHARLSWYNCIFQWSRDPPERARGRHVSRIDRPPTGPHGTADPIFRVFRQYPRGTGSPIVLLGRRLSSDLSRKPHHPQIMVIISHTWLSEKLPKIVKSTKMRTDRDRPTNAFTWRTVVGILLQLYHYILFFYVESTPASFCTTHQNQFNQYHLSGVGCD